MKKYLLTGLIVLLLVAPLYAGEFELNDEQAVTGLKEALKVGIDEAIKRVGVVDGFYKNPDIKILLPEKLKKADEFIQKFGLGALSDSLVEKMNRAAEKAAPEAEEIFVTAIKDIKIEDALNILNGEDTAATTYLQDKTGDSLKESFYPIIQNSMEEAGAVKTYNEYIGKFAANPLVKMSNIELDISQYVTGEAIDGLFSVLAEEEQKIRENPGARVTDILKDIFGKITKTSE